LVAILATQYFVEMIINNMRKLSFIILLSIYFLTGTAQNINDSLTLSDADEIPEFIGGDSVLLNYLTTNFIDYKIVLPKGLILYTVNLHFIVSDSGKIENVKVTQESNNYNDVDKSISEIFKSMPNWKPAINNGKKANFLYLLSVNIFNKTTTYRETKTHQFDSVKFVINVTDISKLNHLKAKNNFYYNCGVKKSQMKDYQGAIDSFTEALKYNSQDIDALYNRAMLKLGLNDITGACSDFYSIKSLGKSDADELIEKYCK
jgi:tetratricopeptide (TPR) repeat protein